MTTRVKAFVEIASLIDNSIDSVAGVGEISEISRTFSVDKRYYTDDNFPGLNLVIFECIKNGQRDNITSGTKAKIFELADDMVNTFNGSQTGTQWLADNHPELTTPTGGPTINYLGQDYLSYMKGVYDDLSEQVTLEIWFSDSVFSEGKNRYSSFEIRIVPPTFPVSDLYNNYSNVISSLASATPPVVNEKKNEIKGNTTPTQEVVYEVRYVDKDYPVDTTVTYWTALCYGPDAKYSENIVDAIRKYLEDNTGYTIDQWRGYLPDILTLENFTLIPLWDQPALTAGPLVTPAYSPVSRLSALPAKVAPCVPSLTLPEITAKAETFPSVWNNINILSLAGNGNGAAAQYFSDAYEDYTLLRQGDQYLSLVSAKTLEAMQTIEMLLSLGENYQSGQTSLPSGVAEVVASGALFLEKSVDGMALRVLTKPSYLSIING